MAKISKEYVELYKQLALQFEKYKEFIVFELESHEMIREGLEKVIAKKEDEIEDLGEALSLPRKHYKYIDDLQASEIVKQKDEIVKEMADDMGIQPDKLLDVMYKAEAARAARTEVQKALDEEAKAKQEAAEEDGEDPTSPTPQSPSARSDGGKSALGKSPSEKSIGGSPGKADMFGGANKLQKDLSVKTIQS